MTMTVEARENRARRLAAAKGLSLEKDRVRWRVSEFGPRYRICEGNLVRWGANQRAYELKLEDAERILADV